MSLPYASILRSGADALLAQGSLHLQLLQVEWELEKLRYRRIAFLLLFGVPLLMCSMLAAGMLVMVFSWNTPFQYVAACLLVLFYSAGAFIAFYRLRQETAPGNSAFAETRREVAADIALLRDRIGR